MIIQLHLYKLNQNTQYRIHYLTDIASCHPWGLNLKNLHQQNLSETGYY
jgi:hypothetical protein